MGKNQKFTKINVPYKPRDSYLNENIEAALHKIIHTKADLNLHSTSYLANLKMLF